MNVNKINSSAGGGRIVELDIMRGIAIIFMIMGHSILVYPVDFTTVAWCQQLHNWIYSFHMEMFFFVSGVVYHCSKYRPYIVNKIDRLVVPMLFWGLIGILFHSFGGEAVNKHISLSDGLLGLMTGVAYWFLYTLFLIFAIYPVIEFFENKWRWFSPVLLVVLIAANHIVNYPTVFRINSFMYYLPYFMVGHLISDRIKGGSSLGKGRSFLFLILSALAWFLLYVYTADIMIVRYLKAFSMISFFYILSQMLVHLYQKTNKSSYILDFLCLSSKYSLQLYLFNGFVLVVARMILVTKLHILNPAFVIPLIVIANLVITLPLCKLLLEKTKWIGWLCGVNTHPWN